MTTRSLLETIVGSDFLPLPSGRKVIFIYHDISSVGEPHHSPFYSTSPSTFKGHIDVIQNKFKIIPLEEMLFNDQLASQKQYAAITFDDGFHSVLSQALPFLKSRSIPFSVFLNKTAIEKNQLWLSNLILEKENPDFLKQVLFSNGIESAQWNDFYRNPIDWVMRNFEKIDIHNLISNDLKHPKIYLNEQDVRYLDQQGVLIGSHSSNHPILSRIKKELLSSEILDNKLYLQSLINKPVNLFAIPFGKRLDYNDEVINVCQETGHSKILTSNPNLVNKNFDALIPRIGLTNEPVRKLKFYLNRPYFKKMDL